MTLSVRIIPCLDVTDGRVVKGVNFTDLVDAGDPVEMAALYNTEGADELTFLDISASVAGRETTLDVVRRTAEQVFIPLTVVVEFEVLKMWIAYCVQGLTKFRLIHLHLHAHS